MYEFSTGRSGCLRSITFVSIVAFILLLLLPMASARDYSLESADVNVTVSSEGIVHVQESLTYHFDGTFSEVYRQVYPPPGGSIENMQGHLDGFSSDFYVTEVYGGYELVCKLPSPTPEQVTFVTSYDYYGGLKVYNDVSELHYKFWGDEWEKPLKGLTATVTVLPANSSDITYWIHPDDYTKTAVITGNTITVQADDIPANSWYEIRVIFPRLASPGPRYVSLYDQNAKFQIFRIESQYALKQKALYLVFIVYVLLALSLLLAPFYLYFKYGREPDITYAGIYERELPYDSKPAVVNAMIKDDVGNPTIDGFAATVMDLIHRDYLRIDDGNPRDIVLHITGQEREKGDSPGLLDFEQDVLDLIVQHSEGGQLHWKEFQSKLKKGTSFYNFINSWNKKVKAHIDLEKLFIEKGATTMDYFAGILFIVSLLSLFAVPWLGDSSAYPIIEKLGFMPIIVAFVSPVVLVLNAKYRTFLGRWTPEGKLYVERWKNFKKYITDFSDLREHPPGSVKLWDHYMVYAMALGVAEEALKNMSVIVPKVEFRASHFHNRVYITGYSSDFSHAYQRSAPRSSSGGSHGAGGGFGGGGGGAR
ncbi:MAG: DUF2207 domain-containing protein [Methanomethylovorans sp.]|uniref:DUF2207 domain-containing protein n=1 Tax=Methanomethylovorans sp. TaxID=2758717 RepID=UPI00353164E0